MKKLLMAILLIIVFIINEWVFAENDREYWSHYEIIGSVNNTLDFKLKPELRYNKNFDNHYYTHIEFGFDWKFKDWLVLSPYYRHVNENKNDDWKIEYRPHLNATIKWKFDKISFENRNRLEYRAKEDIEFFRYRNKLTAKMQKYTQFKIQPYLAEEPFYDFDAQELNKNRIYAGVNFKVLDNLKADILYILESRLKDGVWTNVNVLGTTLKYSF